MTSKLVSFSISITILFVILSEVNCVDPVWKGKRYELQRSDKFDEFLTEMGVSFFKRKFILLQEPIIELIDAGNDEYIIRQSTTLKTMETKFKPGVEFEVEEPQGKIKSKIIFENPNKLIRTNIDGPMVEITYEFTETEVIVTLKLNNVEAKRWFKLI
uniref:CSON006050 protein n=1 Tax=Culicoides sonorensis TaxID=179676 RepID=A0A336JZJ3_CULSO